MKVTILLPILAMVSGVYYMHGSKMIDLGRKTLRSSLFNGINTSCVCTTPRGV